MREGEMRWDFFCHFPQREKSFPLEAKAAVVVVVVARPTLSCWVFIVTVLLGIIVVYGVN